MLFPDLPDRQRATLLTVSERLVVYKVYETAVITDGKVFAEAGTAYGDPKCAAIADDESWCAVGGASVWVRVAPPRGDILKSEGVRLHHLRELCWIEALWPLGDRLLGFVCVDGGRRRIGALDVDRLAIEFEI